MMSRAGAMQPVMNGVRCSQTMQMALRRFQLAWPGSPVRNALRSRRSDGRRGERFLRHPFRGDMRTEPGPYSAQVPVSIHERHTVSAQDRVNGVAVFCKMLL